MALVTRCITASVVAMLIVGPAAAINGKPAGTHDFFLAGIEWRRIKLGTFDLKAGKATLEVTVAGSNPKADPKSYMFGLDYLLVNKK